jgi:malate dehydrogenase (decarboxylating)
MYFSALDKGNMASMVYHWPHEHVKMVVLTDGENVLGDQGNGGMAVVQSKVDIYVASGAFKP